jgi:WD40 repeat protein
MNNHTNSVNSILRINQDQVATSSSDFSIKVWNVNTGTLVTTFYSHTDAVIPLSVLPGGILASGGPSQLMRFWNMQTKTVIAKNNMPVGIYEICALKYIPQYGPNGTLVATGGYLNFFDAGSLNLTNTINTGREYWTIDVHVPTGNFLAGADSILDYFNISNNNNCNGGPYTYNASTGKVNRIKILPDNDTVAIGINNGQIQLFTLSTKAWGASYSVHTASVNVLLLTPDLLYLVSGASDSTIVLWSWTTGSLTQVNRFTVAATVVQTIAIMDTTFTGGGNIF